MSTEEFKIDENEPIKHQKISYLWKTFDVQDRSLAQMINDHEYVNNPRKSVNLQFFLFHMVRLCLSIFIIKFL